MLTFKEFEMDQRLDAIYDKEPLGFERDPINSGAKMLAQDPLEEVNLGLHSSNHPPKPVKIRVLVLARKLRFSRAQSSPIGLYILPSIYMSSVIAHSIKLHSQKPYLLHSQLQGQNGHFTVKSQIFWPTSYFEHTIII